MFTDRVVLEFCAGKGGNGIVAWRREKYLPKGGPCGGDGGHGGSIFLETDAQLPSLENFRNRRILRGENGRQGESNNRRGRNGRDLVLKVPLGTLIKDAETREILCDLTKERERWLLCKGGKGGKGNTQFKTPTNRAPQKATLGKPGESRRIELELKLIADIGLVGLPNAGKSTLLSSLTSVKVKIAPYPFTTLRPNLGFLKDEEEAPLLLADIPGIIKGAHLDKGLGLEFLRHIERTRFLLFVIDSAAAFEERDPIADFEILQEEMRAYQEELLEKPFALVLNKSDREESKEQLGRFKKHFPLFEIFSLSALTGEGIQELLIFLKRKLKI
jgi:GTPase